MKIHRFNTGSTMMMGMTVLFLFVFGVLNGCQKENTPNEVKLETLAANDAAESIANAIGIDNGGVLDQIADVADITTTAGLGMEDDMLKAKFWGRGNTDVSKVYDSLTGWWTVTLTRTRGVLGVEPYTEINRVYQFQFLNKNGQFQKSWKITNADGSVDTAYTMHHKILSGSGIHKTERISDRLLSLAGEWLVTGLNTSTITINTYNGGVYTKAGSDTLTSAKAVRTLNHTLSLTFTNVTGPRGRRMDMADKTSGTINGTYHAVITFQRGELYKDKTIDKTINITLDGTHRRAHFDIDGQSFYADIQTGMLIGY